MCVTTFAYEQSTVVEYQFVDLLHFLRRQIDAADPRAFPRAESSHWFERSVRKAVSEPVTADDGLPSLKRVARSLRLHRVSNDVSDVVGQLRQHLRIERLGPLLHGLLVLFLAHQLQGQTGKDLSECVDRGREFAERICGGRREDGVGDEVNRWCARVGSGVDGLIGDGDDTDAGFDLI
jgi:hypothetical protein